MNQRRSISPLRAPKISFMYQNSPVPQKGSGKQNNRSMRGVALNHHNTISPLKSIHHQNVYCSCGKISQYESALKRRYCSQCAIKQMVKGVQLHKLTPSKIQPPTEEPNEGSHTLKISSASSTSQITSNQVGKGQSRSKEMSQLLKDTEPDNTPQNVESQYFDEESIKKIFKQKKSALKTHYEKIKQAVKESIDEDLKILQLQEKQQVQYFSKCFKKVNEKQESLQNGNKTQNIMSKLEAIRKMASNKKPSQNIEVYDSIIYRMVKQKERIIEFTQQNGNLFSFQGIHS